jgi:hypothetical protein
MGKSQEDIDPSHQDSIHGLSIETREEPDRDA